MKAIVTGSFDPITVGHIELIKYACEKYDEVYVVALVNEEKEYMFTMEQKKKLIELSIQGFKNAIADAYCGLTADYMHQKGIKNIVRGVRNETDSEYEKDLAQKMKSFDQEFETEIIMCKENYENISSTIVREHIRNGTELDDLLPKEIVGEVRKLFSENALKKRS